MIEFVLMNKENHELGKCQYNEAKCPNVIEIGVSSSSMKISFIIDDINLCKICKYYSQGFMFSDNMGRLTL
jgi:hypothetical protein